MLGMLTYVIVLNNNIWNVSARQSDANAAIRNYSEYAAFDDTECRGQDVMSLISKTQGDPFVVVGVRGQNQVYLTSYDAYTGSVDLSQADLSCAATCDLYSTLNGAVAGVSSLNSSVKYTGTGITTSSLQDNFLKGPLSDNNNKYAKFHTYLIYDGINSTNVLGIVAVKE